MGCSRLRIAIMLGALLGDIYILYLPGVLACVWGCAALAKNNSRSELFALLGLFGPIGFAFTAVYCYLFLSSHGTLTQK